VKVLLTAVAALNPLIVAAFAVTVMVPAPMMVSAEPVIEARPEPVVML
jgi:hypothetical protein